MGTTTRTGAAIAAAITVLLAPDSVFVALYVVAMTGLFIYCVRHVARSKPVVRYTLGGVATICAMEVVAIPLALTGNLNYPAWPDLLYAGAAIPSLIYSLHLIDKQRHGKQRLAVLAEVASLVGALGALYWVFAIHPAITDHTGVSRILFSGIYLAGEAVALTLVGLLVMTNRSGWNRTMITVIGTYLALIAMNVTWTASQLVDRIPPLKLAAVVFAAAATLAHTIRVHHDTITAPSRQRARRLNVARLTMMAVSLLAVIATLAYLTAQNPAVTLVAPVATIAAAIVGLLMWRVRSMLMWAERVGRAAEERRLAGLASQTHDVILTVSRNGLISYTSGAISRYWPAFGRRTSGLSISDLLLDADDVLARLASASKLERFDVRATTGAVFDAAVMPGEHHQLVVTLRDVTRTRKLERDLRAMAFNDPLTGLANRAALYRAMEQEQHAGVGKAVLLLDLDGFKSVNDALGHDMGDRLLTIVSKRLTAAAPAGALVARLGGDEFALLCNASDSERTAEQIVASLARPYEHDGQEMRVTTSVGVAPIRHAGGAEAALKEADIAMYSAKRSGKNGWRAFDATMADQASQRHRLRVDLTAALEQHTIDVFYQPICTLHDSVTVGFEALLRWQHPQHGQINPETIVDIASEHGLLRKLNRHVLSVAAADFARRNEFVSVNISAEELNDPTFVAFVADLLATSGLAAGQLTLELTETMLVSDPAAADASMTQLRDLGVKLALDDFGTGYSSLSYLNSYAFDRVKIDREFVADPTSPVTQAILSMTSALSLECVAEGVENEQQRDALLLAGVRYGQGWLFGKAEPLRTVSQPAAA